MFCRRCRSTRVFALDKRLPADNDVYRCRDCGYLFSPGTGRETAASGGGGV